MPPDPNVHVGVAAWVEKDDALLVIRRVGVGEFASDGNGTWSVPGGWLELGETPEGAAEREAAEETGVKVRAASRLGFVSCLSDDGRFQIVTLMVRCEHVDGEPHVVEPEKCQDPQWAPLSTLQDRRLFAPLRAWLNERPA